MINNRFFGFFAIFAIITCSPVFAISDEAKAMLEKLRAKPSQVDAEATVQAESYEQTIQAEQVTFNTKAVPEDIFRIISFNNEDTKAKLASHIKQYPDSIELITNFSGYTPLHNAAQWCKPEIVDLLIKHGANVNATTPGGWTPLDLASRENVKILKAAGAKPGSGAKTATTTEITSNASAGTNPRLSNGDYTIYTGPRGGKYHYSASGKKVYHSKKKK